GAHEVTDGGDAGGECLLEAHGDLEVAEGRRNAGLLQECGRAAPGAREGEVHVHVEEAGGDGVATEIDLYRVFRSIHFWCIRCGASPGDLAVFNDDDGIGNRITTRTVDQLCVVK